jgi:rare lipoprotein A (peptidoglycan hydrolase)
MSSQQMKASGVQLGDWAAVTNSATGQTVWARVEDLGPAKDNEISEGAADAIGIQYSRNGAVGSVSIQAFAGTNKIQGDCSGQNSNTQTQTTSS